MGRHRGSGSWRRGRGRVFVAAVGAASSVAALSGCTLVTEIGGGGGDQAVFLCGTDGATVDTRARIAAEGDELVLRAERLSAVGSDVTTASVRLKPVPFTSDRDSAWIQIDLETGTIVDSAEIEDESEEVVLTVDRSGDDLEVRIPFGPDGMVLGSDFDEAEHLFVEGVSVGDADCTPAIAPSSATYPGADALPDSVSSTCLDQDGVVLAQTVIEVETGRTTWQVTFPGGIPADGIELAGYVGVEEVSARIENGVASAERDDGAASAPVASIDGDALRIEYPVEREPLGPSGHDWIVVVDHGSDDIVATCRPDDTDVAELLPPAETP